MPVVEDDGQPVEVQVRRQHHPPGQGRAHEGARRHRDVDAEMRGAGLPVQDALAAEHAGDRALAGPDQRVREALRGAVLPADLGDPRGLGTEPRKRLRVRVHHRRRQAGDALHRPFARGDADHARFTAPVAAQREPRLRPVVAVEGKGEAPRRRDAQRPAVERQRQAGRAPADQERALRRGLGQRDGMRGRGQQQGGGGEQRAAGDHRRLSCAGGAPRFPPAGLPLATACASPSAKASDSACPAFTSAARVTAAPPASRTSTKPRASTAA